MVSVVYIVQNSAAVISVALTKLWVLNSFIIIVVYLLLWKKKS